MGFIAHRGFESLSLHHLLYKRLVFRSILVGSLSILKLQKYISYFERIRSNNFPRKLQKITELHCLYKALLILPIES